MAESPPLDCLQCPAFCCRMAGYVEVTGPDIARLARHLQLSVPEFETRHIVQVTRAGKRRIKSGYETCQFLGEDRRCGVYEARPENCRGYHCHDQPDNTVYEFARFAQMQPEPLRAAEAQEAQEARAEARAARTRRRRA